MKIYDNTAKLAKNPLGIIALFILLTYGMTSLIFGVVNSNINECQQWAFVIFIIFFPIIVLCIFYKLVTEHHTKLYGPSDFDNEDNFLKLINQGKEIERKKKKEKELEIEEMIEAEREKELEIEKNSKAEGKQCVELRKNSQNIMPQYMEAEKLALYKLAKECSAKTLRYVSIAKDIGFDALLEYGNTLKLVEVKYLRRSIIPFSTFNAVVSRIIATLTMIIDRTKININKELIFTLIFVIDSADVDIVSLKTKLNEYEEILQYNRILRELQSPPIEILFYKMDDLKS